MMATQMIATPLRDVLKFFLVIAKIHIVSTDAGLQFHPRKQERKVSIEALK